MTVWRMRIACWMPKATNTHSEYVIRIAFLPQQWLHERASVLPYSYCRELCTYGAIRTLSCLVFKSLPLLSTKKLREVGRERCHTGTPTVLEVTSAVYKWALVC